MMMPSSHSMMVLTANLSFLHLLTYLLTCHHFGLSRAHTVFGVLTMNIKSSLNFFYPGLRIICFAFLADQKNSITRATL